MQRTCLVAIDGDEILGVLMYNRAAINYSNLCEDLAISQKYRRKGISIQLLNEYVKISRNDQPREQRLVLSCIEVSNSSGIRAHEKAGFRNVGKIKQLFSNKDGTFMGYRI